MAYLQVKFSESELDNIYNERHKEYEIIYSEILEDNEPLSRVRRSIYKRKIFKTYIELLILEPYDNEQHIMYLHPKDEDGNYLLNMVELRVKQVLVFEPIEKLVDILEADQEIQNNK